MDFNLPELPVTCGRAKGILYKEKFKKGEFQIFCALHLDNGTMYGVGTCVGGVLSQSQFMELMISAMSHSLLRSGFEAKLPMRRGPERPSPEELEAFDDALLVGTHRVQSTTPAMKV